LCGLAIVSKPKIDKIPPTAVTPQITIAMIPNVVNCKCDSVSETCVEETN
jgi:hypothetical protein